MLKLVVHHISLRLQKVNSAKISLYIEAKAFHFSSYIRRIIPHRRLIILFFSILTAVGLFLTLNLLTTTRVAPPSDASKWQMGFNSAFKRLIIDGCWKSLRARRIRLHAVNVQKFIIGTKYSSISGFETLIS